MGSSVTALFWGSGFVGISGLGFIGFKGSEFIGLVFRILGFAVSGPGYHDNSGSKAEIMIAML